MNYFALYWLCFYFPPPQTKFSLIADDNPQIHHTLRKPLSAYTLPHILLPVTTDHDTHCNPPSFRFLLQNGDPKDDDPEPFANDSVASFVHGNRICLVVVVIEASFSRASSRVRVRRDQTNKTIISPRLFFFVSSTKKAVGDRGSLLRSDHRSVPGKSFGRILQRKLRQNTHARTR